MSSQAQEWLLYIQYLLLERSASSDSQSLTSERGKRPAASWSLIFRGRVWTDMLLWLILSCLSSQHWGFLQSLMEASAPSHPILIRLKLTSIHAFFSLLCPLNSDIWSASNLLFWLEISLLPVLALVETWLTPLQPSWVETFSFSSLTCSVLFRLSTRSRCHPCSAFLL